MAVFVIMGLLTLSLLILGICFKRGKGLMLLASYNTLSVRSRSQIDKARISRLYGNLMLRLALAFALIGAAVYFHLTWVMLALIFIVTADSLITAARLSLRNRLALTISSVITVIVVIAVGVMFYAGEKEPSVTVSDGQIKIESMYGLNIALPDVDSVLLMDKPMNEIDPDSRRDNGYGGVGDTLKGNFSSKELGRYMLFVKSKSSPTVKIIRKDGKDIYISFEDGERTEQLYRQLSAAVESH